jgi:hypothetical protein
LVLNLRNGTTHIRPNSLLAFMFIYRMCRRLQEIGDWAEVHDRAANKEA